MEIKVFPALIVGVVVALVLAGAVLPVFAETTSAETTVKNDGYIRLTPISAEDETVYNLSWLRSDPSKITVNDDTVIMRPIAGTYTFTVIADTNWILRASVNNGVIVNMQYYGPSGGVLSAGDSLTITLGSGDFSLETANGATRTGTYTTAYIPASNGAYVMKYADEKAYIKDDSLIYGYGITRTSNPVDSGSPGYGLIVSGTIEDGVTVDKWRGSNNIEFSEGTINYVESDKYVNVYEFTSVTFTGTVTATVEDETVTGDNDITYSYVLVPYSFTAEKTVHPDGALSVMLNVLPLLAIAGLVTGAVVWFISRKG